MNALILATALLLQTPAADTAGRSVVLLPSFASRIAEVPFVSAQPHNQSLPFGDDKAKHFMMSYAIASFAYGAGRAAGLERRPALAGAMAGTLAVGAAKELFDRRTGGDPSFADLFADILGATAAYVMLKQVQ